MQLSKLGARPRHLAIRDQRTCQREAGFAALTGGFGKRDCIGGVALGQLRAGELHGGFGGQAIQLQDFTERMFGFVVVLALQLDRTGDVMRQRDAAIKIDRDPRSLVRLVCLTLAAQEFCFQRPPFGRWCFFQQAIERSARVLWCALVLDFRQADPCRGLHGGVARRGQQRHLGFGVAMVGDVEVGKGQGRSELLTRTCRGGLQVRFGCRPATGPDVQRRCGAIGQLVVRIELNRLQQLLFSVAYPVRRQQELAERHSSLDRSRILFGALPISCFGCLFVAEPDLRLSEAIVRGGSSVDRLGGVEGAEGIAKTILPVQGAAVEQQRVDVPRIAIENQLRSQPGLVVHPRLEQQATHAEIRANVARRQLDRARVGAVGFLRVAERGVRIGQFQVGLSPPRLLLQRISVLDDRRLEVVRREICVAASRVPARLVGAVRARDRQRRAQREEEETGMHVSSTTGARREENRE